MKTPMTQMLELLEELLDSKPTRADRTRFETAIAKAKELMEEEKNLILRVARDAYWDCDYEFSAHEFMGKYYNEIFNTKER